MSAELVFLIDTVLLWIGWGCSVWWIAGFLRSMASKYAGRPGLTTLVVGVLSLLASVSLPSVSGRPDPVGIDVPLVWVQLSYQAVGVLVGVIGTMTCLAKAMMVRQGQASSATKSLGWSAFAIASYWLYAKTGGEVVVFRGMIGLTPTKLALVFVLAALGMSAMAWSARSVQRSKRARALVTHAVLLAGTLVFGVPFAWLLVTSFKEDKDISTTQGMVWVPRVQRTVEYRDSKNPYYEATYRGSDIKGNVQAELSGGEALIEIERPFNLRGRRVEVQRSSLKEIPREAKVVSFQHQGQNAQGYVTADMENGDRVITVQSPPSFAGQTVQVPISETEPVRDVGLRTQNYGEMLEWLPEESQNGLIFLRNSLVLVVMSVIGTLLSSVLVGYGFSRLRFPGRDAMFGVLLATMMLPGAVTMLPTFLVFRSLGWIDTLYPIWVPTFFAGAFNVFLLRQFFRTVPMELEDAAKIDGCTYLRTLFQVMVPQIKPVLATIAVWTFMGAWNNFMGPLIYVSTPEHMPVAYALQMFQTERGTEYALMMSFATLATIPTVLLFFFAQRYFIEGVQLSGLGGK